MRANPLGDGDAITDDRRDVHDLHDRVIDYGVIIGKRRPGGRAPETEEAR
jgi:hypothetical protein